MELFCDRLRALRKEQNKTQEEMAAVCSLLPRSYQNYEYGKSFPSFHSLLAIAAYFDVSLDYLVGLSNVRERK